MKELLVFVLLLTYSFLAFTQTNPNHVRVEGYYRSNGTYVKPHYRTAPNSTNRDNFSTLGNVNPYTGKSGYITPDNHSIPSNLYSSGKYEVKKTNSSGSFYSTSTSLNLRLGSSTSYPVIITIPQGEHVQVLSTRDYRWWKVSYNGQTGYVSSAYLVSKSQYENRKYFAGYRLNVIQKTSLRLRPNSQSQVILRFDVGDGVEILNDDGEWWWKVMFNGKVGWIKKQCLE